MLRGRGAGIRLAGGSAEDGPPLSSRAETAQRREIDRRERRRRGDGKGAEKERSEKRGEGQRWTNARPEAKLSAWSDVGKIRR